MIINRAGLVNENFLSDSLGDKVTVCSLCYRVLKRPLNGEALLQICGIFGGLECAHDPKVITSWFYKGIFPFSCLLGTKNIQRGSDPQQLLGQLRKNVSLLGKESTAFARTPLSRLRIWGTISMPSRVIKVIQVNVRWRERTFDIL